VSFSADLSKFCHKEAPEKTNKIVRGVVIEIANRLISRSPVGDGSRRPPLDMLADTLGTIGSMGLILFHRLSWKVSIIARSLEQ